jgi:hypothetical protein
MNTWPGPDPNYKFKAISEDAERAALLAMEVAFHFKEAVRDGISAHREQRINNATTQVEAAMKRLRYEVQIPKDVVSESEDEDNG